MIFLNQIDHVCGFLFIIFSPWAVQYYSMLILRKVESKSRLNFSEHPE